MSIIIGSGVGSKGNDYSTVTSTKPDGGESGSSDSNDVNERGVDIGEDEGEEETNTMTFKGKYRHLYLTFTLFYSKLPWSFRGMKCYTSKATTLSCSLFLS